MKLCTRARDCLFLSWAVPTEALPPPPSPLTFETRGDGGRESTVVMAVLSRQQGLHLQSLPLLRLSYPQFNLRLCIRDGDGEPAFLLPRILLPAWVAPGARVATRRPVTPARFDYPEPSAEPQAEGWSWRVETRGLRLEVTARRGSPPPVPGSGPVFSSHQAMVRKLTDRRRAYTLSRDGIRKLIVETEPSPSWPMAAEIHHADLIAGLLGIDAAVLPPPFAAWLCPQVPLVVEILQMPELAVGRGLPAPG